MHIQHLLTPILCVTEDALSQLPELCAVQGPLIRAVPEQRAEAQEAFTVETSWLSVADVSFADMLQIVDVAAKKNPAPSRLSKASSDGEAQTLTIAHSESYVA